MFDRSLAPEPSRDRRRRKASSADTEASSWGSHLLAGTGRSQSIGSPRCLVSPWCHLVRIVPLGPTHLPCWTSLPEPKSGSFTVLSSDVSGLLTSDPFATPREQAHPAARPTEVALRLGAMHGLSPTPPWFAPRFARHFEGALLFTKHPTALHLLDRHCATGGTSLHRPPEGFRPSATPDPFLQAPRQALSLTIRGRLRQRRQSASTRGSALSPACSSKAVPAP